MNEKLTSEQAEVVHSFWKKCALRSSPIEVLALANCEMKVPLSDEHIPSLTSFRAATNNLSVSNWCITLVLKLKSMCYWRAEKL